MTANTDWTYAPAPERIDPEISERHRLFIDGRFIASRGRRTFQTVNPATLNLLGYREKELIGQLAHQVLLDEHLPHQMTFDDFNRFINLLSGLLNIFNNKGINTLYKGMGYFFLYCS